MYICKLDLKTGLLKFNSFLAITVETHCTLKRSPINDSSIIVDITSLDQPKLFFFAPSRLAVVKSIST